MSVFVNTYTVFCTFQNSDNLHLQYRTAPSTVMMYGRLQALEVMVPHARDVLVVMTAQMEKKEDYQDQLLVVDRI